MPTVLPVLAACGIECAAWYLAGRRIRGLIQGKRTLAFVLCEVALGYGVLGSWTAAPDNATRIGVILAALLGAAIGWTWSMR